MVREAANYTGRGAVYRKHRKGYSEKVLDLIMNHIGVGELSPVADVGAGTGIWTEQLAKRGLRVYAVEPNYDMRINGQRHTSKLENVSWSSGSGESTKLQNNSVYWLTMASSFHWTDPKKSLPEFYRVLREGGYTTLLWNPLLKKGDKIQEEIEGIVQSNLGSFDRGFRSGENSRQLLLESGLFEDVIEIRHQHSYNVAVEDYIATWRAANHFRKLAVEKGVYKKTMSEIQKALRGMSEIVVPYETRSWTARKK